MYPGEARALCACRISAAILWCRPYYGWKRQARCRVDHDNHLRPFSSATTFCCFFLFSRCLFQQSKSGITGTAVGMPNPMLSPSYKWSPNIVSHHPVLVEKFLSANLQPQKGDRINGCRWLFKGRGRLKSETRPRTRLIYGPHWRRGGHIFCCCPLLLLSPHRNDQMRALICIMKPRSTGILEGGIQIWCPRKRGVMEKGTY